MTLFVCLFVAVVDLNASGIAESTALFFRSSLFFFVVSIKHIYIYIHKVLLQLKENEMRWEIRENGKRCDNDGE